METCPDCGHEWDEHIQPPSGEAFDFYDMLSELVEAIDNTYWNGLTQDVMRVTHKATNALALCQHRNCLCRKEKK